MWDEERRVSQVRDIDSNTGWKRGERWISIEGFEICDEMEFEWSLSIEVGMLVARLMAEDGVEAYEASAHISEKFYEKLSERIFLTVSEFIENRRVGEEASQ